MSHGSSPAAEDPNQSLWRSPATILLVDDNPATLTAVEAVLSGLGATLLTAQTGEEALCVLERQDVAVVLLDVQMSGWDGFETARRICERQQLRHPPIIFLTAFDADRGTIERAYSLGAVDFLVKPVLPVVLRAKVSGFVELWEKTQQLQWQAERIRQIDRRQFEEKLAAENARLRLEQERSGQSEARQSAIVNTALDAIITIDHAGQVLEFNPAAEAMFGVAREQALGRPIAELIIPPRLRAEYRRGLANYLRTGEGPVLNRRIEMPALRAGGEEFPVELAITRIKAPGAPLFTAFVRDLTQQKQSERRRAARLAIAETIASARTLREAAAGIVQAVCEALAWDVGACWTLDRKRGALVCVDFWSCKAAAVSDFEAFTRRAEFACGVGLPGRVWSSGQAAWIADVTSDQNFPRAAVAEQDNLHGAFGFPIRAGAEFLGVIEFFSHEIREPNADLLEMMSTIGSQLGQFMQREAAAEALRQSEQRFVGFMQHLPGLAWIKDGTGRYVYANEAAERAFGRPRAELYGKSDHELFPPATADAFTANDRQARQSEFGVQVVETLEQDDGILHHSLVSKFPIRDSEVPAGLIGGMAIDITELKRAEQALRESEERFRGIFNQAAVGVGRSDLERVFIDVNPGLCHMLGYEREELVGRSVREISHQEEWEPSGEALRPLLAGSVESVVMERRYRHKQGHYVSTQTTASLIRDRDGRPASIVAVVQDLTQRKAAEAALLEADRRKDEFLATLAHELRNPLAPICNSLHILRLAGGDASAHESLLEMMERQVNHLVRLVDDLLEISRITRGKIELRKESVELAAVIRSAVEASRPLIEAGQHRLAISLPPQPVTLEADAVRLSQVFANLLTNAAKHCDDGGQIWLTAQILGGGPLSAGEVVVSIKDDGPGIPAQMLPKIFEMFTQIDRRGPRAQGGLGIGLALARSLVVLHGGDIQAHSEGPDQGSEFTVRLPLAASAGGDVPAAAAGVLRAAPALAALRVLIVDDNRDAANSLGLLLTRLGVSAQVVYDGPAALTALSGFHPQVLLLDLGMPGMDGYEVVRQMHRRPELAEVVVVALSGWGQAEDRRKTAEAGFHHHFNKPVDMRKLEALLASIEADLPNPPGQSLSPVAAQPQ